MQALKSLDSHFGPQHRTFCCHFLRLTVFWWKFLERETRSCDGRISWAVFSSKVLSTNVSWSRSYFFPLKLNRDVSSIFFMDEYVTVWYFVTYLLKRSEGTVSLKTLCVRLIWFGRFPVQYNMNCTVQSRICPQGDAFSPRIEIALEGQSLIGWYILRLMLVVFPHTHLHSQVARLLEKQHSKKHVIQNEPTELKQCT